MKPGNYGLGTGLQSHTVQKDTKAVCSRKSPVQAQHPSSSQTSFATVCPTRWTNGTIITKCCLRLGDAAILACVLQILRTLSSPERLISNNLAWVTKKKKSRAIIRCGHLMPFSSSKPEC